MHEPAPLPLTLANDRRVAIGGYARLAGARRAFSGDLWRLRPRRLGVLSGVLAKRTRTPDDPFGGLADRCGGRVRGAATAGILAYKHGRRDVGDALGALLAARCDVLPEGAVLVPVPTTRRRRGERGFDQSVRLAEHVGARTGHPVLAALSQRAGDAQRGRSRAARLRASGRFACVAPHLVAGMTIVLVDDVVTTGATLRDCVRTLRAHGASVAAALVLAYA